MKFATKGKDRLLPSDSHQIVCLGDGGLAATGPFMPTPPPPPWKLARKCRTMGAEGARSKFCLNQ